MSEGAQGLRLPIPSNPKGRALEHARPVCPVCAPQVGSSDTRFIIKIDLINPRAREQREGGLFTLTGSLLHEMTCLHTLPNHRSIITSYAHFEDEYHYTDEQNRCVSALALAWPCPWPLRGPVPGASRY